MAHDVADIARELRALLEEKSDGDLGPGDQRTLDKAEELVNALLGPPPAAPAEA